MSIPYSLRNFFNRCRGWREELALFGVMLGLVGGITILSELRLTVTRANGAVEHLGVVGRRCVTTAGVNFIVDAYQNLVELEAMKYHAFGTGAVAENITDTALGTEVASRATGSQTEGSANQYVTVGTVTFSSTLAITEHGILSAASVGVLLDRTVFAAVNVLNGDSITATYTHTVTAGS